MNANETNSDKSITDKRLCLHHYLNKDLSGDNQAIVVSTPSKSVMWPFVDHRLTLKRSTSADSVLMADSYQLDDSGQTLTAHNYQHRTDRSTQTPEEWEKLDKIVTKAKKKDNKSESVQTKAKSQQKKTDIGLVSNKDQSTQINEYDCRPSKQMLIPSDISPIKSIKSGPIAIPVKLSVETSRSANSVEELNQEIESLVLKGICGYGDRKLCDRIPEGHRAPVIEMLCPQRAVKTQTIGHVGSSGEDSSDLSQPESPIGTEPVSSTNENGLKDCISPKINKFLTREPPDGCEKIKILTEEDRNNMINGYTSVVRPVQPSSGFVLLPSRSSAFLPIFKPNELTADYIQNRIDFRKS